MINSIKAKLKCALSHLKISFYNLSMRKKLLITFVLISLIPTLFLGLFYYSFSYSNIISQKTSESYNVLTSVGNSIIDSFYEDADYSLIRISQNETVGKLMQSDMSSYDYLQYQLDVVNVKKLFIDNTYRRYIDYICIIGNNDYSMTSSPDIENSISEVIGRSDFLSFKQEPVNYWNGPVQKINGSTYKVLGRKVYNSAGNELVGYIFMWINERGIQEVFDSFRNNMTGVMFILNPDGMIFASTGSRINLGKDIHNFYPELNLTATKVSQKLINNGQEYLACTYQSEYEELYGVNVIPLDDLVEDTNNIIFITVAIMFTLLLICFFSATLLSRYFTVPILKLAEIMTISDIGQVPTDSMPKYNDEIGYLTRCFNQMGENLNHQAVVIEQTQKKQREAELKAFESQIKPHFLYNTLSTVIWLISANQSQAAIKVTSALSKMFRISISRGSNIIPIEKEIEHVASYLDIQKVRYENEFTCEFETDIDILSCFTVKMVLQPLVENSIYHSMRNIQNGVIVISCKQKKDTVLMQVRDNGGFMSEEKCALINAKLENLSIGDVDMGIGIKNVHDRIRYHYGASSGLQYKTQDGWTIAEITIPIQRSEDKCQGY